MTLIDMTSPETDMAALETVHRRWRKVEIPFVVLLSIFFVYAVLLWRGVIGDGTAWRPLGTVLMVGGLLAQSIASLVIHRARPAAYLLWAAAVILFVSAVII
jgi:hypothetical protein